MSKFGSKEEIIKVIENHFIQMKNGKLSLEDLELLVEQTRELYERTLILKYKAYEEKVFGEEKIVSEKIAETSTESIKTEPEISPLETDLSATKEPVFDFDIFNENTSETITNDIEEEKTDSNSFYTEEIKEDIFTKQDFIEPKNETPTDFFQKIQHDEVVKPIENSSIEMNIQHDSNEVSTIAYKEIFKKILQADHHLGSNLMLSKLDTLVGAFGFNEKIQFIQDLFKASSEDFNQAIEVLDNLQNFEEAQNQLEYYIHIHKWDLESDIVAEFIRKIERRYR